MNRQYFKQSHNINNDSITIFFSFFVCCVIKRINTNLHIFLSNTNISIQLDRLQNVNWILCLSIVFNCQYWSFWILEVNKISFKLIQQMFIDINCIKNVIVGWWTCLINDWILSGSVQTRVQKFKHLILLILLQKWYPCNSKGSWYYDMKISHLEKTRWKEVA